MPDTPEWENMARMFLEQHPEHIAGVERRPSEKHDGERRLMFDKHAALALMEWALKVGATRDPEKLRRNIELYRKELGLPPSGATTDAAEGA